MPTLPHFHLHMPQPYDFARSVSDHGWIALEPCRWLGETAQLERIERLSSGRILRCCVSEDGVEKSTLIVTVDAETPLSHAEQVELQSRLAWMLKLDEDLQEFYLHAQEHHDAIWQTVRSGRGRLLRSPTLWEDVVKTICTTNITWKQTKSMVQRLVSTLGETQDFNALPEQAANGGVRYAFPTPEQVLEAGNERFADQVRMGYRNAYVMQLAREVVAGSRDLEALRTARLDQAEMRKELLSIKGIGNYAAHTLLALLGYYSEVGVDSEYRNFVRTVHYDGGEIPDKELAHHYDDWGEWKYLAYWFDATQHQESTSS